MKHSMASIDDLILRSANPFDNLRSVNFWRQYDPEPLVESIHQGAIVEITALLAQVAATRRTRTVIVDGDSGSGKTYLLGRLQKALNPQACFAYIPAFPQSDHIWRHILRYMVDSLVQVPQGQKNSQLLRWLKGILSATKQRTIKDRLLRDDALDWLRSDRRKFINKLKTLYKSAGLYNPDAFLGVLYDLANPRLYAEACQWLRGDDLSEDTLLALQVKQSIETEQAAREILSNFGKMAIETQPIVLCFDELESIAHLSDGRLDLQTLFQVNSKIRNEDDNFLIIISILTNTWKNYESQIDQSHLRRIDRQVSLGFISLEQAEAILASRLYSLHAQAQPRPDSPIYPLLRRDLEAAFPGGKTNPGDTLLLGREIFQDYKEYCQRYTQSGTVPQTPDRTFPDQRQRRSARQKQQERLAGFQLKWQEEQLDVQKQVSKIRLFSSPELIQMLREALLALQVAGVEVPLLNRTQYASYSLQYQWPKPPELSGVIWTEDQGMANFFNVMNACRKGIDQNLCRHLTLIRAEGIGQPRLKGHQIYRSLFTGKPHRHLKPDLASVQCLATYYRLVKTAREGDLVLSGQATNLRTLQALVRESGVLDDCRLLQDLGVATAHRQASEENTHPLSVSDPPAKPIEAKSIEPHGKREQHGKRLLPQPESHALPSAASSSALNVQRLEPAPKPKKSGQTSPHTDLLVHQMQAYLLSMVRTQQIIGLHTLRQNTRHHFSALPESEITAAIHFLCQDRTIQVLNPTAPPEAQLICWRPDL